MKRLMQETRTMKRARGPRVIACAAALTGLATFAEDLAWTFDTSGRAADVVMASAPVQNPASVVVPTNGGAESATIGFFDSRWSYGFLVDGLSYVFKRGLVISVK